MENQLVPQSSGALCTELRPPSPTERTLLKELDLTAEHAKTQLSAGLQSEYLREFENEAPELIERIFRAWRRRSKFMPTVSELYELLEEVAEAHFLERQTRVVDDIRSEAAGALKQ